MVLLVIVMLRFGFIDFDRFRFDFSINNSISILFGFDFLCMLSDLNTSVRPIMMSDIGHWHIGGNLTHGR